MDSKTMRNLAAAAASDEPPVKTMEAAELSAASPDASSLKRKADKTAPGDKELKKEDKTKKQKKVKATAPPATQLARSTSTSPEKAAGSAASKAAKPPPPEKAAASKAAKTAPPKKPAASKGTKSPPPEEPADTPRPKKAAARKEVAATLPPTAPADETKVTPPLQDLAPAKPEEPQEEDVEVENLEEKKDRYTHLWDHVVTSGEDRLPYFKKGFLKMDDEEARVLDTKLRNMQLEKEKKGFQWDETNEKVTRALLDLIQ